MWLSSIVLVAHFYRIVAQFFCKVSTAVRVE